MLYLRADYSRRSELEKLGAEWDFTRWAWKIDGDYKKFSAFLYDKLIIRGAAYIVTGKLVCPYCGADATTVALAYADYIANCTEEAEKRGKLYFSTDFSSFGGSLLRFLNDNFTLSVSYDMPSAANKKSCACPRCRERFSDRYLFGEPSSPFNGGSTSTLTLYPVLRGGDMALPCRVDGEADFSSVIKRARFKKISAFKNFSDKIF